MTEEEARLMAVQAVRRAIDATDGKTLAAFGALFGKKHGHVSHWLKSGLPAIYCPTAEKATGIRRWEFRPLDWHIHWPDIVGRKGAPQVPEKVEG